MAVQHKLYTASDLWAMQGETKRLELVKGVPTEMAPTGEAHGVLSMWLGYLIVAHVEAHNLGQVTGAETGFILATNPDTVRAPDIGFITSARLQAPTTQQYFPGAPDLAVEIVSPGDKAGEIQDKVLEYLQAGTQQVWVIYPGSRTVVVHRPDGTSRSLKQDDILDGGEVLPGFSQPVQNVFKKLRE